MGSDHDDGAGYLTLNTAPNLHVWLFSKSGPQLGSHTAQDGE